MTVRIRAHFDGKHLVPDEPVDLPLGKPLEVDVTVAGDVSVLPIDQWMKAFDELLSHAVSGVNIPLEALDRENLYDDRGR